MRNKSKRWQPCYVSAIWLLLIVGSGCSTIQGSYIDKCQKNTDKVSTTNYMHIGEQVHLTSIAYFNDADCSQGPDAVRYWGGENPVIHKVNDQTYILEFTQKRFIEQNNNEQGRPTVLEKLRQKGYAISPDQEANYLRTGVLEFQSPSQQTFIKIERTGHGGVVTPWISEDFNSALQEESELLFEQSAAVADYFDWVLQRSAQATAGVPPVQKPATAEKMATPPTEAPLK